MHLVLLVGLVEVSIMDQKVGLVVVVGGDIHLECEMYAQRKEKDLGDYNVLGIWWRRTVFLLRQKKDAYSTTIY